MFNPFKQLNVIIRIYPASQHFQFLLGSKNNCLVYFHCYHLYVRGSKSGYGVYIFEVTLLWFLVRLLGL